MPLSWRCLVRPCSHRVWFNIEDFGKVTLKPPCCCGDESTGDGRGPPVSPWRWEGFASVAVVFPCEPGYLWE